ncbi:MAG: DNA mismatch repair endonuclease MutL [Sphingobacteriaceae bacterium]|nr:DNA mismatch repair endonuclease MutL [Sphingobacteriaceae bacterium]
MADIIQLLSDALANQIAAGEVVQRPASAVKELLENAVDAGANDIQLVVKDAGKTLIQVVDNGCGMSVTDARMCFERHATSKIRDINDLFRIRTFGFRGEAMASIAAVAQVELKTRRTEDELGTHLRIEGSSYLGQEPAQLPAGTSILVKNLFYNVPARRNFLKKDETEFRNICDEFLRLALSQPGLQLSLVHNNNDVYRLRPGNLRQRIVGIMGDQFNTSLVPVDESTPMLKVNGFIGKPNTARKSKGNQYFFVNNRFIRDPYLHHAVMGAYAGLLPDGAHPTYFLFLELDPKKVDVNVHPTKTEVKFEEEQALYAILQSAIKRALSQYNVAPSLDFERETGLDGLDLSPKPSDQIRQPQISFNPHYNPFSNPGGQAPASSNGGGSGSNPSSAPKRTATEGWHDLYEIGKSASAGQQMPLLSSEDAHHTAEKPLFQLHRSYIVSQIKSGLLLVDQQAAHERILYEKYLQQLLSGKSASQQLLFPEQLELSKMEAGMLQELWDELARSGFVLERQSDLIYQIKGVPTELVAQDAGALLRQLLDQYRQNQTHDPKALHEQMARTLAHNGGVKSGKILQKAEMQQLIDELFACENPYYTPDGKQTLLTLTLEEVLQRLKS